MYYYCPMLDRRHFLASAAATGLACPRISQAKSSPSLSLKSGAAVPAIGMGTWLTFNINPDGPEFDQRSRVLDAFFKNGGSMIDSSPMYGRAEAVIGKMMRDKKRGPLFSATKIWTVFDKGGPMQLADSHRLWEEEVLDLVYVHNLLNWENHIKTLRSAKDSGQVRNIGFTTSHGRRHSAMEKLIRTEPVDAVQFTYNILDRDAENRLLPAAANKGLSVIINRPFQGGRLFDYVDNQPLPDWASEWDIQSWASYFLKFIISHPAVSIAIPATSQVAHMEENMRALQGPLPGAKGRAKMATYFNALIKN